MNIFCHGYGAFSKGDVGQAVKLCNMYVKKVRTLFQVWPKWLSTVLITAHFIIYHCTFWVYHCTNWLSLHTKIRYFPKCQIFNMILKCRMAKMQGNWFWLFSFHLWWAVYLLLYLIDPFKFLQSRSLIDNSNCTTWEVIALKYEFCYFLFRVK